MGIQSLLFKNTSDSMLNRWVRHLVAGGMGTLIYTLIVAFFVEVTLLSPVVSVVFAFLILEFYIYVVNRAWVYQATKSHIYSVPRFLIVTVIALALNTGIMFVTVEWLKWWYFWGLVFAAFIVPQTNFLLNYYWAFK
jgi:putative flippase GtrA